MKATDRITLALSAGLLLVVGACSAEEAGDEVAEDAVQQAAEPEPTAAAEPAFRNAILVEDALAGGQPTEDELAALAEQGFETVINMRMPDEDATTEEVAEALGMNYVSLPIDGSAGLTEENAIAFAELLGELDGPAVVHCGSGNRVGAMYALKAFYVDGMSPEEALAVGQEAGLTRLEGSVREQLGLTEEPPE
jgi:uncharacterized protein (TIGR01244 family)